MKITSIYHGIDEDRVNDLIGGINRLCVPAFVYADSQAFTVDPRTGILRLDAVVEFACTDCRRFPVTHIVHDEQALETEFRCVDCVYSGGSGVIVDVRHIGKELNVEVTCDGCDVTEAFPDEDDIPDEWDGYDGLWACPICSGARD